MAASIGMAAGSGSYSLGSLGTLVTLRLEMYIGDTTRLEGLFKFIRRIDPKPGQLDFKRLGDNEAILVIACDDEKKHMLPELLASHRIVTGVQELEPRHWSQEKPRISPD